jgi:hypothetical protein
LTNSGFDGTVTERDFSRILRGAGVRDSVETAAAWAVTQGTGRQVSVAPGVAYAAGVVSDSGVAILAALPTPVNGQWHLVVRRINWASNTVTVATIPHTTTTTTIPTAPPAGFPAFNDNTGVLVDQHLAWAWVRSTDTTVAVFDLRQTPISSGFLLRETLRLSASTTFVKANYPWLRAIRVRLVGGGAGGGGASPTASNTASIGGSGGGGAYAESFITNIAGLAGSVTVTVGTGGAGGSAGGNTSFGAAVSAAGAPAAGTAGAGIPPFVSARSNPGGDTAVGDFSAPGGSAQGTVCIVATVLVGSAGGDSLFGPGAVTVLVNSAAGVNGNNAVSFGSGGSGGANPPGQAVGRTGGSGRGGVVVLELFS